MPVLPRLRCRPRATARTHTHTGTLYCSSSSSSSLFPRSLSLSDSVAAQSGVCDWQILYFTPSRFVLIRLFLCFFLIFINLFYLSVDSTYVCMYMHTHICTIENPISVRTRIFIRVNGPTKLRAPSRSLYTQSHLNFGRE